MGSVSRRVCVVGQGYVGLPLAIASAKAGLPVVGFDIDEQRITRLKNGESPIDDVSADVLREVYNSGLYMPTSDEREISGCDVFVITVPTPLRNESPDTSAVAAAATTIARYIEIGSLVILESTSYPGTTEEIVGTTITETRGLTGGRDYHLAFSPERIDPGNPLWNLCNTPKLVAGVDRASRDAALDFYANFVTQLIPVSDIREAEFAKLLENTFRQVNIALVNELMIHAHRLGINFREVVRAAATKPFGFMSFVPGPGVGGHCLPIDPEYLSWKIGQETGRASDFITLATQTNRTMPEYVVSRITDILIARGRDVADARILVLGLSYKANSRDARESPAVDVVRLGAARGMSITVFDPIVEDPPADIALVREVGELDLGMFDLGVLLTNHETLRTELLVRSLSCVLDTRYVLHGPNVVSL